MQQKETNEKHPLSHRFRANGATLCLLHGQGRKVRSISCDEYQRVFLPHVPAWQAFQFTKPRANLEFSCKSTILTLYATTL